MGKLFEEDAPEDHLCSDGRPYRQQCLLVALQYAKRDIVRQAGYR